MPEEAPRLWRRGRCDALIVFTSASLAYLDRARVLAKSVRRHHPNWQLVLCLVDIEPTGFVFDPAFEPFDRVIRLADLTIPDLERWIFPHDVVELCTAVKGAVLDKLLSEGRDDVIYLDPDTAIFSPFDEVEQMLAENDILLTPHQLQPEGTLTAIIDNEIGSLKYGIYNLGFIAVANTAEGRRFAAWWRDRLTLFCFDDVPNGLFTDQRWCDHVPSFFPGARILRHPGYNVASWNLSQRPITIEQDGMIRAGGFPLRFYHFTKATSVGEVMIERYSEGRSEIFELLEWYLQELRIERVVGLPANWWAFATFSNGSPVLKQYRRAYRLRPDLQDRIDEPFNAGDIFAASVTP